MRGLCDLAVCDFLERILALAVGADCICDLGVSFCFVCGLVWPVLLGIEWEGWS